MTYDVVLPPVSDWPALENDDKCVTDKAEQCIESDAVDHPEKLFARKYSAIEKEDR